VEKVRSLLVCFVIDCVAVAVFIYFLFDFFLTNRTCTWLYHGAGFYEGIDQLWRMY